jgi:uncharacterized protein YegP (UPF0339 family)
MDYTITKRTFKALQYPKGSSKRIEYNASAETSEYMTSYKYHVRGVCFSSSYRTKAEAQQAVDHIKDSIKL